MKARNIILGIDGVPYDLMVNLSKKGIMPNFKELMDEFTFKKMNSSIPHISSVSWSSIITGTNPGEHGIFGFTDLIKNTYTINFPNFNALKAKPFWLKNIDKKHVIINVPSTYPVKKLNGVHIAGFISLNLENAVYPKEYIEILRKIGYEIDVDTRLAHQQANDVFIDELFKVLNVRTKTFDLLWEKIKWDNFMPTITGSDRIGHFLWNVYEDNTHKNHQKFLEFFHEIDKVIGSLWNRLKDDDTFIILSDHGMEQLEQNVYLNTYLERENYLHLSENARRYNRITRDTKAFALDPGRIYINKKGKYPNGKITKLKEKEVIDELKTLLYDLKFKKQKVIKKVYEKEDIYFGKMIDYAPDLVLVENKGFDLKGTIGKQDIFNKEVQFSGKHNENAFLLINRDIDIEKPKVEDVLKLLR